MPTYEDTLFKARVAEAAFDRNPDGLLIVSATGEIRAANEAMVVLCGWPMHELLHQQAEVLVPEHLRERHVAHRAAYIRDPQTRAMGETLALELLHHDGDHIPVRVNLAPLLAPDAIYTLLTVQRRGSP